MSGENIDDMLKTYFSGKKELPEQGHDCPSLELLSKYAAGELEKDEFSATGNHIKNCAFCKELIEDAAFYSTYSKQISFEKVPHSVKKGAKRLNKTGNAKTGKTADYIKRNIWFVFFVISLMMSFITPRYFMQFLILATVMGLKWIFNKESTRTLVMIYNAWKRHNIEGERDMDEIFKNRMS